MQPQRDASSITDRPFVRAGIAIALLAALAAVFLAIRVTRGSGDDDTQIFAPPTGQASVEPQEPDLGALDSHGPIVGERAPDFALRSADGEVVKLSALRGKVVFVNFWATWCKPCKEELPAIQKLYDEKRADGLEVLTVNYQESRDDARSFFADLGLSLPILLDRSGSVYDEYRLQGLPDSFFVDRDGNLAAVHYGFMTEEKMRQRLEQAGLR